MDTLGLSMVVILKVVWDLDFPNPSYFYTYLRSRISVKSQFKVFTSVGEDPPMVLGFDV